MKDKDNAPMTRYERRKRRAGRIAIFIVIVMLLGLIVPSLLTLLRS